MSGEGDGGGGYGGYSGGDYGGGGGDYGYGGVEAAPAYGGNDVGYGNDINEYVVQHGSSVASSNGGDSRRRSKHNDNDDAASDVDEMDMHGSSVGDDVPGGYGGSHLRNQQSAVGLDSTREIYKTNAENKGAKAPSEGLTFLCIIFCVIFVLVVVVLLCFEANMMVIVGVFGNVSTDEWNYGWDSGKISYGDEGDYVDTYTSRVASDAGTLVLLSCLMSIVFVFLGLLVLCVRYSSNLPLFSSLCCIRIPHRATIYTILNTIELFTRRITIAYLILGIYGLLEMTYYVSYNCTDGSCYAYIYPHFGWGILLVTTLMISLCGFSETRKLDVKLNKEHFNLYWPEHGDISMSRNNPIDLERLLKCLSNHRKILLNCVILICLQESGMLTTGVITTDVDDSSGESVDVALLQPNGWNVREYYGDDWTANGEDALELDDNSLAQTWMDWGQSLRDVYVVAMVLSMFNMVYLWVVLTKFSALGALKWLYIVVLSLLSLVWLMVTVMFYYTYYDYFSNGTGWHDIYTGPHSADEYNRFFFPGWGFFILVLNFIYMAQCIYYAFKGM